MAEIVSVDMPDTPYWNQISDESACAMVLQYALREKVKTIELIKPGQRTVRYDTAKVKAHVYARPWLHALAGIGNPEPTPGVANIGSRCVFLGRLRQRGH